MFINIANIERQKELVIMELNGQTAIITGAASGLGRAIAKKLESQGARLALIDLDKEGLTASFEENENRMLSFIDITRPDKVEGFVTEVANKWGRIDVLVNSAGIAGKTNILSHEADIEDVKKVFDVNFMASFYLARSVIPFMLKRDYGRILHIASISGKEGNAGMLAYSSSKAAVIGMAKVQGKEYAHTGITVNALAPAVIQTPMVDALPEEQVKYMTDKIPMKRCGALEEVANIAAYIVSPQNSFTTGFTFDLSGGRATY